MRPPSPPPEGRRTPPPFPVQSTETWVFDLDNTLYDAVSELFVQISARIGECVQDLLDLEPEAARAVQKQYFVEYGTTLRGLMSVHGVDPKAYLRRVHDVDYSPISPAPRLDAALAALPGRKIIFTNADVPHSERILDRLGVRRHFDAIFDIEAAGYVPKPEAEIYDVLIETLGFDPARATMVEDISRNLEPAAARGMSTVWLRTRTRWGLPDHDADYVHHVTDDLAAWLEDVAAGD